MTLDTKFGLAFQGKPHIRFGDSTSPSINLSSKCISPGVWQILAKPGTSACTCVCVYLLLADHRTRRPYLTYQNARLVVWAPPERCSLKQINLRPSRGRSFNQATIRAVLATRVTRLLPTKSCTPYGVRGRRPAARSTPPLAPGRPCVSVVALVTVCVCDDGVVQRFYLGREDGATVAITGWPEGSRTRTST